MAAAGIRHARRANALALVLLTALSGATLTGCTGSPSSSASSAPPAPAPHTTSARELCVLAVTYWAGQQLTSTEDTGLDYQEMGLADGENTIVGELVRAATAERALHGTDAALALIRRQGAERCALRAAHPPEPPDHTGVWAQ